MNFIPDGFTPQDQAIPYFEDSQQQKIPGRRTEKSVQALQSECVNLLGQLGASSIRFVQGHFPGEPKRHGYQVFFWYGGVQGRIDCAALPIRSETERRKDRALAQAVYLLRDELQAIVYSVMHKPGAVPLIPYLMNPEGKTLTEFMIETQNVPVLMIGAGA